VTPTDANERVRAMTVVKVRPGTDAAEVLFVESARVYRLRRDNAAYEEALRALRAALESGGPVHVVLAEPHGDVIEGVTRVPRPS
jgi:hypothetical protein